MSPAPRHAAVAALQWQDNGELMPQEAFDLVRRLRRIEPSQTTNELWRLGHKYPEHPSCQVRDASGFQQQEAEDALPT